MKNKKSRRNFLHQLAWGGAFAASISSVKAIAQKPPIFSATPKNSPKTKKYWEQIRQAFPLSNHRMYFNTGSQGASPQVVIDTVYEWMNKLERIGESGHREVEAVRAKIANFINADVEEIAITRNTTEGVNIAANSLSLQKGDEVIITTHEHIGGAAIWLALQQEKGIVVKLVELDLGGKDNLNRIKNSITSRTKVIAVSHVTCTTGMVLPIQEIILTCKERGIYSCIDGAHPLGMMSLDMKKLSPDFYAASGHKWLLGPKETGILYINKNILNEVKPSFVGACSDEKYDLQERLFEYGITARRYEYGTRNTPLIMGLGAAIDFINTIGIINVQYRERSLAEYLKTKLSKIEKVEILSPMAQEFSSAMVTFRIEGMKFNDIQEKLRFDPKCRVRGIHENHLNGIRISCTFFNDFKEMDKLIAAVEQLARI